jgi:hypothetical protein
LYKQQRQTTINIPKGYKKTRELRVIHPVAFLITTFNISED